VLYAIARAFFPFSLIADAIRGTHLHARWQADRPFTPDGKQIVASLIGVGSFFASIPVKYELAPII